jgi:YesN/AraC family two-component response regulator
MDFAEDTILLLNIDDELSELKVQKLISAISSAIYSKFSGYKYSIHLEISGLGCGFRSWNRLYSEITDNTDSSLQEIDYATIDSIYAQYKKIEPEILTALTQQQSSYACKIIKMLIEHASLNGLMAPHLMKICISCYNETMKLTDIKLQNDSEKLNELLELETAEDVQVWLQELFVAAEIKLSTLKRTKNSQIVETVLHIVKTQYNNLSIDVASISKEVYLSPNYLRTIFKEHTNKSLSKYITEIRIENACELLVDSACKISNIPEQVGLLNNPHFYFLFKKYTGYTPSEYRFINSK